MKRVNSLTEINPAAVRQAHVKNAEMKFKLVHQLQRFGYGSRSRDEITKLLERRRDQKPNVRIVVDVENPRFHGGYFSRHRARNTVGARLAPVSSDLLC